MAEASKTPEKSKVLGFIPVQENYYDTKLKKHRDISMGMGISILFPILIYVVLGFTKIASLTSDSVPIAILVIILLSIIYFFLSGRRFLAIGLMIPLIAVLLLFGACFVLIANAF